VDGVAECLPTKYKAPSSNPNTTIPLKKKKRIRNKQEEISSSLINAPGQIKSHVLYLFLPLHLQYRKRLNLAED
jgi:hypothetical protein